MKYYSQVRDNAKLDFSNFISRYLKAAFIPNQGSGQVIKDLVSGQEVTFNAPLIWNSDGSVTQNELVTNGEMQTLPISPTGDLNTDDIIVVVHAVNYSSNSGNKAPMLRWQGTGARDLVVQSYTWGVNTRATVKESWETIAINSTKNGANSKSIVVYHWVNATNTINQYEDGVLTGSVQGTKNASNPLYTLKVSLGLSKDKFYSSQLYSKTGAFTQEELNSIILDPYGVFETTQDSLGKTYYKNTAPTVVRIASTPLATNSIVEVGYVHTNNSSDAMIFGNYISGDTNRWLVYSNNNELHWRVGNISIGTATINVTFNEGQEYIIRQEKIGNNYKLYVDSTEVASATQSATLLPLNSFLGADDGSFSSNSGLTYIYIEQNGAHHYFPLEEFVGPTINSLTSSMTITLSDVTSNDYKLVIPTNIYSVGSGRDYSTAAELENAVVNIDKHKVGEVYGDTGESDVIAAVDQLGSLELRAATGEEVDFKGGGAKLGTAAVYGSRSTFILKNLRINNYLSINGDLTNNNIIDSCHIDNNNTSNGILLDDLPLIVKNTLISNCNRGIYSSSSATKNNVQVYDSILVNNNDYNGVGCNFTNCIASGATTNDFLDSVTIDTISEDNSGSIPNTDFTGAYLNASGGDYRINQSWADTNLVGKGFNNSDIAKWAYYEAVATVIEGTLTDNQAHSIVTDGIKIVVSAPVDGTILITFSIVDNTSGEKIVGGNSTISESSAIISQGIKDSEGLLAATQVLLDTLSGTKSVSSTIDDSITIAIDNIAEKEISSIIAETFDTLSVVSGDKNALGIVSSTDSDTITETGLKSIPETISQTENTTSSLTSEKIGLSTLAEPINLSILDKAVKLSLGTLVDNNNISLSVVGNKVVLGLLQGTLTINVADSANLAGYKTSEGTIEQNIGLTSVFNTLKLLEGDITSTNILGDYSEGIKIASDAILSASAITSIASGDKVSPGSVILINQSDEIILEGQKTAYEELVDVSTLLIELQTLAVKLGDLESVNAIDSILSGVNTESTHIKRLDTILGTVSLRHSNLIGLIEEAKSTIIGTKPQITITGAV